MIRAAECPVPDHVGRQAGGDTCFPLRRTVRRVRRRPARSRADQGSPPRVCCTPSDRVLHVRRSLAGTRCGGGGLAVVLLLSSCRCQRQGFAARGETPASPANDGTSV